MGASGIWGCYIKVTVTFFYAADTSGIRILDCQRLAPVRTVAEFLVEFYLLSWVRFVGIYAIRGAF